jgi:hypothetical protein
MLWLKHEILKKLTILSSETQVLETRCWIKRMCALGLRGPFFATQAAPTTHPTSTAAMIVNTNTGRALATEGWKVKLLNMFPNISRVTTQVFL